MRTRRIKLIRGPGVTKSDALTCEYNIILIYAYLSYDCGILYPDRDYYSRTNHVCVGFGFDDEGTASLFFLLAHALDWTERKKRNAPVTRYCGINVSTCQLW